MFRFTSIALVAAITTSLPARSPERLTGHWRVTGDSYGTNFYQSLDLTQHGKKLTGKFGGDQLEGSVDGNSIHFFSKDGDNDTQEVSATLAEGTLTGTMLGTEAQNPDHPSRTRFTAILVANPATTAPLRHEFTPTVFYRDYSPANKPALTVNPGDSIHTTTVDAGGVDQQGEQRNAGGNPQTGPFYVNGAEPGDTLVVRILHLKLNRDWAESDDNVDPRALDSQLAVKMKDNHNNVKWHLDLARGNAAPDKPDPTGEKEASRQR